LDAWVPQAEKFLALAATKKFSETDAETQQMDAQTSELNARADASIRQTVERRKSVAGEVAAPVGPQRQRLPSPAPLGGVAPTPRPITRARNACARVVDHQGAVLSIRAHARTPALVEPFRIGRISLHAKTNLREDAHATS